MKWKSRKEIRIRSKKEKQICEMRADFAAKEKPTEKAKEHFKRKAYSNE